MFQQYKAWYRGVWGKEPRQLVTVTGISLKNGRIVLDCIIDNTGADHWGYVDQFDPYKED